MNKVGGQAVLEGVMMKSGDRCALSVRTEDGTVKTEVSTHTSLRKKYKFFNIPIIRGIVNMIETFGLSFSTLERSAEMAGLEDLEPESKFERWLTEKLGDKMMGVIMGIAGVLGVVLAMFLFMFLPAFVTKVIEHFLPFSLGFWKSLIEGIIKIAIFVAYMGLVALMPDIRRTYEYHGAEHKSIACYERGLELTPENAKTCSRLHPRCGTSFIFVVLILSILVFSLPIVPWDNLLLRLAIKLPFIPLIVGLSFEFIMYAGRHDNIVTKVLSAPGLAMQRITTKEPSEEQLAVAIASIKAAMPDIFPEEARAADEATAAALAEKAAKKAGTDSVADATDAADGDADTAASDTEDTEA